jgi:HPt (histidine-containing phosphotransfer) domain-containing protein
VAHTLKGNAANFGAAELRALCARLEALGRDDATGEAEEIVRAARAAYGRVEAGLAAVVVGEPAWES